MVYGKNLKDGLPIFETSEWNMAQADMFRIALILAEANYLRSFVRKFDVEAMKELSTTLNKLWGELKAMIKYERMYKEKTEKEDSEAPFLKEIMSLESKINMEMIKLYKNPFYSPKASIVMDLERYHDLLNELRYVLGIGIPKAPVFSEKDRIKNAIGGQ